MTLRPERLLPGGLLLFFLIKALLYSAVVPFNGYPDEAAHLTQIRIAQFWPRIEQGRTDTARVTREVVKSFEGITSAFPRPPSQLGGVSFGSVPVPQRGSLYYRSLGLLMRWLGVADPLAAWRLARKISILTGLAVVLLTWLTARMVFPERIEPALLAAGLVVLIPQFGAMSAAVNPDVLAVLFGAIFFYGAVRAWLNGPTRRILLLGACLLAVLPFIKKTAFFTLPFFLLGGALWFKRSLKSTRSFYLAVSGASAFLLGLAAVFAFYPPAAELFVSLFGLPLIRSWGPGFDPLLFRQDGIIDLFIKELRFADPLFWLHLKTLFLVFFKSFWAYFGYLEAPLAWWWYALAAVISLAGVGGWAGLLFRGADPERRRIMVFLGLGVLVSLAVIFIRQVVFSPGSLAQGRHLFPALVPLALGWAAGLVHLRPRCFRAGCRPWLWPSCGSWI